MGLLSGNNNGGPDRESVLAALGTVHDPDLHQDLVSLGMIKDLNVDGGNVSFTIELTTPACPMKEKMKNDCHEAVSKVPGVKEIDINLTAQTPHQRGVPDKEPIPGVNNIIAVSSGKGGVGKSTVAVNIALALHKTGAKVALLDADAYGPNIPQMLGLTDPPESDGEKIFPPERDGVKMMSVGLIASGDQPVMWRGPMLHSVLQQFLQQVAWGELDYMVVDMPPGTGDAQLSLTQLVPLAGAVMVTTPQEISQADVRRAIMMFKKMDVPILGLIENMAYFHCPDNDKKYELFGKAAGEKLAQEYKAPFLGRLPIDPRVAMGGDNGKPVVLDAPDSPVAKQFGEIAAKVAQQVSIAAIQSTSLNVVQ